LYFSVNDLGSAHNYFENARKIFENKGKNLDSVSIEAMKYWVLAREFWEGYSSFENNIPSNLEKSRECYLKASAKFKEVDLTELSFMLEVMSKAIFISEDFFSSLHSKTLEELRIKMLEVHRNFLPIYRLINSISFLDVNLMKAQFICVEILKRCLNSEKIDIGKLHWARMIFDYSGFSESFQATTAVENFLHESKKYRKKYKTLEEIPRDEGEILLNMLLPFSIFYRNVTEEIDTLTRKRCVKAYPIEEVREAVREEVYPLIEDLGKKIVSEVKSSKIEIREQIKQHHVELLQKIQTLNSDQLEQFNELIFKALEEEFENLDDIKRKNEGKKRLENMKNLFSISKDFLSFIADIISIYVFLKSGDLENAMNLAFSTINTTLSKTIES
jgi:hypothetical protein